MVDGESTDRMTIPGRPVMVGISFGAWLDDNVSGS